MRALLCLIAFGTHLPAADLIVKIGESQAVTLSAADLELLPHQTVKAADHGGHEAEWRGIALHKVLQLAGFELGERLRGPALAQYVLVTAADGYRAVFALPEIDPRSTDDPILLCATMNGAPLPSEAGPLRLVLPAEMRHFRWVRRVAKIEVKTAE